MTVTPTLLPHARQRCEEMGISTKIAKRIVQTADLVYPGKNERGGCAVVAMSSQYPDYAVVYVPGEIPQVVTVLFRTQEEYVREGATWRPLLAQSPLGMLD